MLLTCGSLASHGLPGTYWGADRVSSPRAHLHPLRFVGLIQSRHRFSAPRAHPVSNVNDQWPSGLTRPRPVLSVAGCDQCRDFLGGALLVTRRAVSHGRRCLHWGSDRHPIPVGVVSGHWHDEADQPDGAGALQGNAAGAVCPAVSPGFEPGVGGCCAMCAVCRTGPRNTLMHSCAKPTVSWDARRRPAAPSHRRPTARRRVNVGDQTRRNVAGRTSPVAGSSERQR